MAPSPPWSDSPWLPLDLSPAAFIAPNATIVGQVTLGSQCSVWYQAVVRGDVEAIHLGPWCNVQDGAVLHCDPGEPLILAESVTIGHRAVVHSAQVERGCLIGIGAIVLNGASIGAGSIIGAGAVVTKSIPPRSLVMGVPGKVVRSVTDEEAEDLLEHAQRYVTLAQRHAQQCYGQ